MMKKILIVFTGGTFSMMMDSESGGAVPRFSGEELLKMIPEAKDLALKFHVMILENILVLI